MPVPDPAASPRSDADPWRLDGRLALVTGATRGIGRAITLALLERGARVLAVARRQADLDALAADHADVIPVRADIASPTDRDRIVAACSGAGPTLDVLVHNVGTNIRRPTEDFEDADVRAILGTNAEAPFALSRALHPQLAAAASARGDASVVCVSSIASRTVVATSSCAYAMSKRALDAMTDWLAVEWGPAGIRVNAVHPWYIRTPLVAEVLEDADRRERIEAATPLGRVGEPDEVARAVLFLCLPAASYVSGAHLDVDGAFRPTGLR